MKATNRKEHVSTALHYKPLVQACRASCYVLCFPLPLTSIVSLPILIILDGRVLVLYLSCVSERRKGNDEAIY